MPPRQRRLPPVVAALALLALPAAAQDYGTAARVNGVTISSERLTRYFEEFLGERGRSMAAIRSPTTFKELKRQALDQLIEQELLWQEAQRTRLLAPAGEVDAAVRQFRAQFPDDRRRQLALERGGFTDESYRAWVRQQLSVARLVEKEIAPRVRVTDAEVRDDYQANLDRFTEAGLAFEEARASIEERLLRERRREAVQARATALRQAGSVEILIPL
jgi:peptidyl-prolyl cis-trans isomerase C